MSTPRIPAPGLLLVSVLAASWRGFEEQVAGPLRRRFGPEWCCTPTLAFTQTTYYDAELGAPLERRMLFYEQLQPLDGLPGIKLFTNGLERATARADGSRTLNLDPGFLTLERLVLATGKNFTHRIYLGSGIWGDLTLLYQRGEWRALPWTFADYASASMRGLLSLMRAQYKERLANTMEQGTSPT